MSLHLTDKITSLHGVGSSIAKLLKKIHIETIKDLLYHFPTQYKDTSTILNIQQFLQSGYGTLILEVQTIRLFTTPKRRMPIIEATAFDGKNYLNIKWFNQQYVLNSIKPNEKYIFNGKLSIDRNQYYLSNPDFEKIKSDNPSNLVHLGRITPTYSETKGLTSKRIRYLLVQLKSEIHNLIVDNLDPRIIKENNFDSLQKSIYNIHFPQTLEDIEKAKERIAFSELYNIQLKIKTERIKQKRLKSLSIVPKSAISRLLKTFPHELTNSQKKAVDKIINDIQNTYPMHRLLAGDVGSGKTIVALASMVTTIENGYNVFFMAPTTILAHQHYQTLCQYLPDKSMISLVTSEERLINPNEPQIFVGTHALLHFKKQLSNEVGLVVIDEQHRFGVKQRGKLAYSKNKNGTIPHYLIMSATPIPRTMALSIFGNLDLSYLKEMPLGRIPIKTYLGNDRNRKKIYKFIREKIETGINQSNPEQLVVICPLIEKSEVLQAQAVMIVHKELKEKTFSKFKVALIHGRLNDKEKQAIISDFANCKYDILVATPVIEVGIDIPEATLMIIESSERFGLAQLHQLRGRIGRRSKQSYCFLFNEKESDDINKRLEFFAKTTNGIRVAEYDLKRRGPGEVYGIKQSGLPDLRLASLDNVELMEKARDAAFKY